MEILDFMNAHENWEDILTQPPYSIIVKRDGGYILLKYSQFNSDMSLPIVQECRGSIFYQKSDDKYVCVCYPFKKFFNENEGSAANIDWSSAVVEEKVDGSLIKFWNNNNKWRVSTNGTIDAFSAIINDTQTTFGDLVTDALGGKEKLSSFFGKLDKNIVYMFELTSPMSRVVIYYPETKLYYLGQRNMLTLQESKEYCDFMYEYGIGVVQQYNLHTLFDCLNYVKTMSKDQEGFVVRDKYFNRVKIKSPEYLMAAHLKNNGVVTTKRIIEMIRDEQIDDFLAYCPEYTQRVLDIKNKINETVYNLNFAWTAVSVAQHLNDKEFAIFVKNFSCKDFLFKKRGNPELSAMEYLMSKPISKIKEMISIGDEA